MVMPKPAEPPKPAKPTVGGVVATGAGTCAGTAVATGVQQGWTAMEIIGVLAIIAVIGAGVYAGWRWYQNRKKPEPDIVAEQSPGLAEDIEAQIAERPAEPVGIAARPLSASHGFTSTGIETTTRLTPVKKPTRRSVVHKVVKAKRKKA